MRQLFVWNERSGEARGPFELKVVEELYETGVLKPGTLVAARGEKLWTTLDEHAYTADWFHTQATRQSLPSASAPKTSLYERAQTMQNHSVGSTIRHAAYDPDYDLEILDLNPVNRRRLRDYAVLTGGLNLLIAAGFFLLPANPITMTMLLTGFTGGNISLSWLFGFVLRY